MDKIKLIYDRLSPSERLEVLYEFEYGDDEPIDESEVCELYMSEEYIVLNSDSLKVLNRTKFKLLQEGFMLMTLNKKKPKIKNKELKKYYRSYRLLAIELPICVN